MGQEVLSSFLLYADERVTDADIINRSYAESKVPVEKIISLIQKYDTGFTVTDEDRAKQEARKEISQRARTAMLAYQRMSTRESMFQRYGVEGKTYARHDRCLFDFSGTEQAEENNRRFAGLRFGNDRKALGKYAFERVMEAQNTVLGLLDAPLEKLIEECGPLCLSLERIMEIPNIIKDMGDGLDDEQLRKLKVAEHLMIQATEMVMRVDLAACPLYARLPLERVDGKGFQKTQFLFDIKKLALEHGEPLGNTAGRFDNGDINSLHGPTATMGEDLHAHVINKGLSVVERVSFQMANLGGDPRAFFYPSGEQIPSRDKVYERMLMGEPVLAAIPGQGLKTVSAKTTVEPPEVTLGDKQLDEQIGRDMAQQIERMIAEIKDSSPWWMVMGSREFAHMKKAMGELARAADKLTYPVDSEKATEMRALCQRAGQYAEEYFAYKVGQRKEDIRVDSNGSYLGKNIRETKRLQAATKLQEMSRKMNFLLDACADPSKAASDIHKKLAEQEAEELRKEREAEQRRKEIQRREAGEEKGNTIPEEHRCKTSREDAMEKLTQMEKMPLPGKEYEEDKFPDLWGEMPGRAKLFVAHMMKNQPIWTTSKSALLEGMEHMVMCHMVQMERKLFRDQHPNDPFRVGPLEENLLIDKKMRLRRDPVFLELIGEITPARLERFLMNEEYKTMGKTYLDRVAQKQKEKQDRKPSETQNKKQNGKQNDGKKAGGSVTTGK